MIPLVLITMVVIISAWHMSKRYHLPTNCYKINLEEFVFVFIMFMVVGLGMFFLIVGVPAKPAPLIDGGKYSLKAIQDGNNLEGSFFLGSGSAYDKPVYSCYLEDKQNDNSYRRYIFPAEHQYSRVVEGNVKEPYVEVVTEPVGSFKWTLVTKDKLVEYVFYVPPNSIVDNFVLDAK
jgi:hypothetical protein